MFATLLIIYFIALLAMIFVMHIIAVVESEWEIDSKYLNEYRKAALFESKPDWNKCYLVHRSQYLFCMREP